MTQKYLRYRNTRAVYKNMSQIFGYFRNLCAEMVMVKVYNYFFL